MAVGHNSFVSSPKTGNIESCGAHAQSTISPKVGKKERVDWVYPLLPGAWHKNRITWSLAKGPSASQIGDSEVKQSLERAFHVWEEVADVKFYEATIPPEDIEIRVEYGTHCDKE